MSLKLLKGTLPFGGIMVVKFCKYSIYYPLKWSYKINKYLLKKSWSLIKTLAGKGEDSQEKIEGDSVEG